MPSPDKQASGTGPSTSARPNWETLLEGILAGNRTALAQAITLVESKRAADSEAAGRIVEGCLPHSGRSIRIGITGVPGAGKSTFIERLGGMLLERGHRVAVLAVDPSSSLSKGSILGDKTRMEDLARHPNAFRGPAARKPSQQQQTQHQHRIHRTRLKFLPKSGYHKTPPKISPREQFRARFHSRAPLA